MLPENQTTTEYGARVWNINLLRVNLSMKLAETESKSISFRPLDGGWRQAVLLNTADAALREYDSLPFKLT